MERLTILNILPKEGNFTTLKILGKLKESLAVSEEEYKDFEIRPETDDKGEQTGRVTWNEKGIAEKEIEIGEKATDIVVDALKELDKNKKLTNEHYTIYEKFIE